MTLVASTIPNLVSGVSQQPAPSRLRTAGEVMDNGFPTVVSGLIKRPPSEYISPLSVVMTLGSTGAVHMIDRSATEKYILVCGQGDLELYDTSGVKQTVTFPDGKGYLPTTDMWEKLRFITVADTTFILNTEKVTATSAVTDTRVDPTTRATVFVKNAVASVSYAVYINGTLRGSFATSDNTTASTALEGTSEIASGLATALTTSGYTVEQNGPVLTINITSGDTISVSDEFGGRAMEIYTDSIQEFENLPPYEQEGRLVKVSGNLEEFGASYWVEYNNGVWTETVGYNAKREFDAATLPHVLVKTGAGTFEFRENVWEDRGVGDADSNPDPSFVGSTINGIFLFKGRMGLLSEENVIMSEVGLFEQLYRTTVIQLLDSDPIDVASATGRVSTLYHAASFSDELILFSDKQQFRLSSGQVLSPETVGITNSTAYPCSTFVAPVTVGASSYFVADGATNTLAREIFIDGEREQVNGEDIAIQVPSYIPKNIRSLTASSTADTFMSLSADESNIIYVYKWYIAERRKVQSAWCRWVFDDNTSIVGMGFLDNYLYLVKSFGGGVHLERILVGPLIQSDLLLDHQITQAQFTSETYDGVNDWTEIVLPYSTPATVEFYRTDADQFAPYDNVTKVSDTTYRIPSDVTGHSINAGLNYEFRYRFSQQYLREQNPDGESAIQDGRLQLRYYSLIYTDTSYFEAHVTPTNGTTKVYIFNGRILADPDNVTDLIPSDTGEFKFPIFAQNEDVTIDLVSNQPYKCAFGSVEWSASYKPKARRVQ